MRERREEKREEGREEREGGRQTKKRNLVHRYTGGEQVKDKMGTKVED